MEKKTKLEIPEKEDYQEGENVETVGEKPSNQSVESLLDRMRAPREKIEPPKFLDDFQFLDGSSIDGMLGKNPEGTNKSAETDDEVLTEADQEAAAYLDYTDEHRTTAIWIIRTIDRGMGLACNLLSGDDSQQYQKYTKNRDIGDDYLDVTAALVKKYQARMSLEVVFASMFLAAYIPNLTIAYKVGKVRRQAAKRTNPDPGSKAQANEASEK